MSCGRQDTPRPARTPTGAWTPSRPAGKLRLMPASSHTRPRALSRWLALMLLFPGTGCLTIPEDLDDPDAAPSAPSTVQELLDRHILASGGPAALRALTQRTVEA